MNKGSAMVMAPQMNYQNEQMIIFEKWHPKWTIEMHKLLASANNILGG